MKYLRRLYAAVFLTLSVLPWAAAAQRSFSLSSGTLEHVADLDFENLNTRDTLPHQSIYAFTQDTAGYLWIATYGGLSRYDGNRFRTYAHQPADPSSLPTNNIRNLLPAPHGNLWLGTDNAGVVLYNARTDSFEPLPNVPASLRTARIYALIADGQGGIWAGGQFGLFHYSGASHALQVFPAADTGASTPLNHKRVFSLYLDRSGSLWVGSDAGVAVRPAGSATFKDIPGLDGPGEVGLHPSVWSFAQDHTGKLWVGCDQVGLATYDPAAKLLRGVPGLAGTHSQIGEHTVRGILEHAPGELWLATYGGGLITYAVRDGYIRSFTRSSGTSQPLRNNFLRDLFKDRSGVVWLATDNGVATLNDSTAGIYTIHPTLAHPEKNSGTEIRNVAEIGGQVWIGLDQGELGTLTEGARIQLASPARGESERQITGREILAIQGNGTNTAYAGGTGLFSIDLASKTYRALRDPLIQKEVVSSLAFTGDDLWAGTYNGLYHYNAHTGQSHMDRHDDHDPGSLSENDVRTVLGLRNGHLWLTTRTGLNLRDPANGRFHAFHHIPGERDSLPSNNLWALAEDHLGRLWVASMDAGLAVLTGWTPTGQPIFRTIDVHSGLPSNSVLSMTVGKDGHIWANTASGLAAIEPGTLTVRVFAADDGLHSTSQKFFGSTVLNDGSLLFRGADGLLAVIPGLLERRSYRAPLVLSSLAIQGGNRSPTLAAYDAAHTTIQLDPRHHGFTATVALLNYTAPENTRYAYKLEGFDKAWTPLADGDQTIRYSDLPPGDFTLHVRADDRYHQGPLVESSFRIHAPRAWYATIPFRLLMTLVGFGLVYLLIRIRTSVLERHRRKLEIEVVLRTAEVEEQRDRLADANRLLQELATRDSLTDIYNRRFFMERLESEHLRSRRYAEPFSLLLMDIDHFKSINDTFGHLVGDAVIKGVAVAVSTCLRVTDTLARFGGEEYIVLLPNTAVADATVLAGRILLQLASTPILANGLTISPTVSIGCTGSDPGVTTTNLLERADKALYQAKKNGRNCFRIFEIQRTEPTDAARER